MNMFKLRFRTEAQALCQKGMPPQITTGVASKSSIHWRITGVKVPESGRPGAISDMDSTNKGTVKPRLQRKRRVISRNSPSSSPPAPWCACNAMPHEGHGPGAGASTPGHMGQT